MPTYEYVCQKCNHQFDLFQSINDNALTVCPKAQCGQPTWGKGRIKRMISVGGGLIFKGSGFYITDYRSKEYKDAAKKDVAPISKSSDTKPATPGPKAETKTKD